MDEKDLYSTVVFDVLALSLATLLSTINVLTYIFMVASIILLFQAVNDLRKYKLSKVYNKNKVVFLIALTVLATVALCMLISVVATKNIIFTYVVYAVSGVVLLTTIIIYSKELLDSKKAKNVVVEEEKKEYTTDFIVKEMGTLVDRGTIQTEEYSTNKLDTDTIDNEKTKVDKIEAKDSNKTAESIVNNNEMKD